MAARFAVASNHTSDSRNARTGYAFDPFMLRHGCSCQKAGAHVDTAARLSSIHAYLTDHTLLEGCMRIIPRYATADDLKVENY